MPSSSGRSESKTAVFHLVKKDGGPFIYPGFAKLTDHNAHSLAIFSKFVLDLGKDTSLGPPIVSTTSPGANDLSIVGPEDNGLGPNSKFEN